MNDYELLKETMERIKEGFGDSWCSVEFNRTTIENCIQVDIEFLESHSKIKAIKMTVDFFKEKTQRNDT